MAKNEKAIEEKAKTDLAEVKSGALAAPTFMDADDFGGGFEGADRESYAMPFLQILQKMSPVVDEDDAAYIEGAKAGMLMNSVTHKLYDGKSGLLIVPCAYQRQFVEWGGRESNDGGFKGAHTPEEVDAMLSRQELVAVDGRYYRPDENGKVDVKKSNYVADTRAHFVIAIDPETGDTSSAVLSLSSTQIKASRTLMTMLQQKKVEVNGVKRTPPTFANLVRVTTVGMSNDKGSWSGARFELEGLVSDPNLYEEAKALYKSVNGGKVKADFSKQTPDSGEGSEGGNGQADNF